LNTINVGFENTTAIDLHYQDAGEGRPVIFVHGWPVDSMLWVNQSRALLAAGCRVISYDRRGFGKSSRPCRGYDYDTLADDLHHIIAHLDLYDAILVGFTTGCGEIFRYLGTYGSERISKSVFVSTLPPFPQSAKVNPIAEIEAEFEFEFEKFRQARIVEGLEIIQNLIQGFFIGEQPESGLEGENCLKILSNVMRSISLAVEIGGIHSWSTDFTDDLRRIAIPTLVIHGEADSIAPVATSAATMVSLLANSRIAVIKDAPHGLPWTNADQLNDLLIEFIGS
jgi:pimeloyl-ACP methyl ester carboxylesterase